MNNYRETLLGKKCGIFPVGDRQIATLYCKRDLDCKALMINRNSDEFEFMVMCDIVHLPRDKGQVYIVVQPNEDIPTVYEMNLFINDFLKESEYSKADKIWGVLYRCGSDFPYGVIVEKIQ